MAHASIHAYPYPSCWYLQKWEDLELIYAGQRMANGKTLADYHVPPVRVCPCPSWHSTVEGRIHAPRPSTSGQGGAHPLEGCVHDEYPCDAVGRLGFIHAAPTVQI